jgi:hypothetical protein
MTPEILSKCPEKICDQKDKENGSEPDSGSATRAVSAMPVEASPAAQHENENDNDNQHLKAFRHCSSFPVDVQAAYTRLQITQSLTPIPQVVWSIPLTFLAATSRIEGALNGR